MPLLDISPIRADQLESVLTMWKSLLDMTAKVSPRYRLSSQAVEIQRKYFLKHWNNHLTFCFVATLDKEPAGFANGYVITPAEIFEQRTVGMIENIFVRDEHRRQGIGALLVNDCYEWFHEKEVTDIYVNVVPANELSFRFWEAMGYDIYKMTMAKNI